MRTDDRGGDGGETREADGAKIARARQLLADASGVLVLSGAGVSADSGVPTFRGEDGLWNEYRPEELANPAAFRRDPRLVWEWYGWRRELVSRCEPNAAHLALARWTLVRPDARIVTQNVDGLHTKALERVDSEATADEAAPEASGETDRTGDGRGAGEPAFHRRIPDQARPLQLHGSLFRERCTGCDFSRQSREPVDATSREALPRCPECGSLLRPDVVWFGESLDPAVLEESFALTAGAGACLVVGTSAVVHPAASLATEAVRSGAVLVEVNPEETPLTRAAEVSLRAGAADVVPPLLGEVGPPDGAS